jgi:hypothetical protein
MVVVAKRLDIEVDVHRSRDRVGDAQRWQGEEFIFTSWLMRPSKLRFPESTDTTVRSRSLTTFETSSGSGPLLPMQVVQP